MRADTARERALQDELDALSTDFGLYVYHTTNGELSKPYDVQMLNAKHDDAVTALVEEETARLRAENAALLRLAHALQGLNWELKNTALSDCRVLGLEV